MPQIPEVAECDVTYSQEGAGLLIGGVRGCKSRVKDEYLLTKLEDGGESIVFFQRD